MRQSRPDWSKNDHCSFIHDPFFILYVVASVLLVFCVYFILFFLFFVCIFACCGKFIVFLYPCSSFFVCFVFFIFYAGSCQQLPPPDIWFKYSWGVIKWRGWWFSIGYLWPPHAGHDRTLKGRDIACCQFFPVSFARVHILGWKVMSTVFTLSIIIQGEFVMGYHSFPLFPCHPHPSHSSSPPPPHSILHPLSPPPPSAFSFSPYMPYRFKHCITNLRSKIAWKCFMKTWHWKQCSGFFFQANIVQITKFYKLSWMLIRPVSNLNVASIEVKDGLMRNKNKNVILKWLDKRQTLHTSNWS